MSYLISDKEIQTPYSMIVAGKTDGSRTLFNFLGRKSEAVWPVPAEAPDVILTDGHEEKISLGLSGWNGCLEACSAFCRK